METTGEGGDAGRAATLAANSFRRQIPQRAVRAHGVVIHPPSFDHLPCVSEIHEPVLVQTLIAKLPVETLDERVLRGLAALDEMQRHLVLIRPLIHDAAGVPRRSRRPSSTRTTRRPGSDVSGSIRSASRV